MKNSDDPKEVFYQDLKSMIAAVFSTGKLIFLGDFGAKVGTDGISWEGVLETEGIGSCNSNGLLETCAANGFLIANYIFHLPN